MPAYGLSDYVQFLVSGTSSGCIYVLVALGLITLYNVTGVINLAQGEYAMLGAMLAIVFQRQAHLPLALAFLCSVMAVMAIGLVVHRLTLHPARRAPEVTLIMITIGTAIAMRGLALMIWGTTPYSLPEFTIAEPMRILGAVLSRQRLWIMGTAAVVLGLLYAFFEFTLLGKAVRACAINRQAAELLGIDTGAMALLSYGFSAALGAVAGIVIAPLTLVSYDMGLTIGLKGFVVAIMGNMVNAPVAVAGGLLLGIVESLTSGLLSSGIKDAVAFVALFVVLLARTLPLSTTLAARRRRRT